MTPCDMVHTWGRSRQESQHATRLMWARSAPGAQHTKERKAVRSLHERQYTKQYKQRAKAGGRQAPLPPAPRAIVSAPAARAPLGLRVWLRGVISPGAGVRDRPHGRRAAAWRAQTLAPRPALMPRRQSRQEGRWPRRIPNRPKRSWVEALLAAVGRSCRGGPQRLPEPAYG